MVRLPERSGLNISYLSRLFDNMSESYKIFWFKAILEEMAAGRDETAREEISFDTLINHMIADAWYMVEEYRLNLGPSDTLLEAAVSCAGRISGLKSSEKREKILAFLEESEDSELKKYKRTLCQHVPFRLQAPFMPDFRGNTCWKARPEELARRINQRDQLIYYFVGISGLDSRIRVQKDWASYMRKNQEILSGWIQYNLILYLQRRNPSVPGISSKLRPPAERKLERVKRYWKTIVDLEPVHDIYSGQILTEEAVSIDHFVPWSYVAHDELWNLTPTIRSVNSSKSNALPDWERYFVPLCHSEYQAYRLNWKYESVHKLFESCKREHVNSGEAEMKLYREGLCEKEFSDNLRTILLPVYQAAKNQGFADWRYHG
ncbi:HNH endonuclease domain-containing protein [Anaerolentibacter hominis]|uniref:HNH endonuclease domain-containing protein n=1 Tax=Anaerolentibacter hominis TaxID=3079009 RepID=UPI0031B80586